MSLSRRPAQDDAATLRTPYRRLGDAHGRLWDAKAFLPPANLRSLLWLGLWLGLWL